MEIRGCKEYKQLILIYDEASNSFIDKTSEIFFLKREEYSWLVGFTSNHKYYHKKLSHVKVSTNPVHLEFNKDKVYVNGKPSNEVVDILKFDQLGYKIVFKNLTAKYSKDDIFTDDCIEINLVDLAIRKANNNVVDYYKTLSKYASDISEGDSSIESLLYKLYANIKSIDNDTALADYTKQRQRCIPFNVFKLIYPFSTNESQMQAVKSAFTNNISIISGPPGTGKTQVILNLICNAIIDDKKIAIISNNNTAVENVYDKMKEEGLDFLMAYLGNMDNVDKFFSKPDNLGESIKNINRNNTTENVNLTKKLEKLYIVKNNLTCLEHELYEIQEEFNHYKELHSYIDYTDYFNPYKNSEKYISLKNYLLTIKKINFISRLKLSFKYNFQRLDLPQFEDFIIFLEYKFFEKKIDELNNEIQLLTDFLKSNNVEDLNKQLKVQGKEKLNNYIYEKYHKMSNCSLNKNNYKDNFSDFMNRYPVLLSTTHSLLRNIKYGFKFDMIIIDEASQSDIMTSLLAMNVTKQMVIVGDSKQLSQIDNQKIYDVSEELINNYNIDIPYAYKDNSILNSVLSLNCNFPNIILKEHYRCDQRIIDFCNKKFYDNK